MQTAAHIMVVDDDAEIRSLLGRYLREQGFRVSVAANRREQVSEMIETDFRRPHVSCSSNKTFP